MADIYGSDLSTFAGSGGGVGADPLFRPITGPRVVLEAVARRLMTPRGALLDFPDYGYDLQGLIGKRLTGVAKRRIESDIKAECEAEERVLSATIIDFVETALNSFRAQIQLTLAEGTFDLVLGVDEVTVRIHRAA